MSDSVIHRDALPPGTRLREFELLEVLGRGGFGITYLGWHTNLGITLAVKEYMPSPFAIKRIRRKRLSENGGTRGRVRMGTQRVPQGGADARVLRSSEHRSGSRLLQDPRYRLHGDGSPEGADPVLAVRSRADVERKQVAGIAHADSGGVGAGSCSGHPAWRHQTGEHHAQGSRPPRADRLRSGRDCDGRAQPADAVPS